MWTIAVSLLLIGAFAGLLAIPVDVSVTYRSDTDKHPHAEVVWLFGGFRHALRLAGGEKKQRGGRPNLPWQRLRELWGEGLGDRVKALLRSLRRAIGVHELFARAHLGTGDPAETGQLMGFLHPLRVALVSAFPVADLHLEPDFTDLRADADVRGAVRIVPLTALPPMLRFAFAPVTLRAVWAMRRGKESA